MKKIKQILNIDSDPRIHLIFLIFGLPNFVVYIISFKLFSTYAICRNHYTRVGESFISIVSPGNETTELTRLNSTIPQPFRAPVPSHSRYGKERVLQD